MGIDIHKLGPEAQRQVLRKLQAQERLRRDGTDNPSVAARQLPLHKGAIRAAGGVGPYDGAGHRTVGDAGPCDGGSVGGSKGGKYRNVKAVRIMPNGQSHVFDSQAEARRYDDLHAAWKMGAIRDLRLQQTFTLQESYIAADGTRVRAIKYVADFTYTNYDGEYVVEDVKSKPTMTRVFQMNRKLMAERFGIQIKVVCE